MIKINKQNINQLQIFSNTYKYLVIITSGCLFDFWFINEYYFTDEYTEILDNEYLNIKNGVIIEILLAKNYLISDSFRFLQITLE